MQKKIEKRIVFDEKNCNFFMIQSDLVNMIQLGFPSTLKECSAERKLEVGIPDF